MNPSLLAGTIVVNFALLSYTIAIINQYRKRKINNTLLGFLSVGVLLDIIATTFMIIGSSNSIFTLHGLLGYSALLGMIIDMFLMWRIKMRRGIGTEIVKNTHIYSIAAYSWWIIAYITGAILVMMK